MDDAYYTGLTGGLAGCESCRSGSRSAGGPGEIGRHGQGTRPRTPLVRKFFVWNATNLSRRIRGGLVDLFVDYGARVRIVYLEVPPAEQRRRNATRRDPVPEAAFERMLNSWEPPKINEAHRVDWIDATN
ncbi:MAG: ATP-binding protein [Proteobacteria bacterium]|nr:ATP-binding protein [Pseudomonadota bacterium]